MTDFKVLSLMLTLVIIYDAVGDALRAKGKQIPHHILEVVGVAMWFVIVVLIARGRLEWHDKLLIMYITCRIAIFDVIFNVIKGNKWSYVGTSSIYGIVVSWFTNRPMIREQGHLIWVIRVMALIWWVAWFITNADGWAR